MRKHFHASANVPGYLPEGDVETFTSKRAAMQYVAGEARYYREHELDLPRSERRVGSGSAASGAIHLERPNDSYDLGVTIWWVACVEADCDGQEEE